MFPLSMAASMKASLLACAFGLSGSLASAQELTRHPYPQNMKTDSVDVLWQTDQPTETWVWVSEKDGDHQLAFHSTVPVTAHEITVPGLKPDTIYEYYVGTNENNALTKEPFWFHTFPEETPEKYQFVAYGDHRNYPEAHRSVVEAILKKIDERGWPRFVVDTGDYTGQGEQADDPWNREFFDPVKGLIEYSTFFTVIGNHESPRKHPRIPLRYLQNFSLPTDQSGTEYYYTFTFGDAEFFMIDAYATDYETGSKQWEWLRQALKDSDAKWKFASMHYPIFIHRSGPSVSYGNMEIREHLVPLFEQYGVTAVFSGDSHFYQRSEVNGIHYICTGGGGAPLYDPGNDMDYIRASHKDYHYAWVTMEGDQMKLDVFDPQNQLIDTMTTGNRVAVKPPAPKINFVRNLPAENATLGEAIIIESRDAEGNVTPSPLYSEENMASSSVKSSAAGLQGSGTRFSDNVYVDATFTFTPPLEEAGDYLVSITLPDAGSINAPNTLFEVSVPNEETIRGRVDLSFGNAGNKWYDIGVLNLTPGSEIKFIEVEDEPGRIYSDAIKFQKVE